MGRPFVTRAAPQMPTDSSQSITKGGFLFDVPTGLAYRQLSWVEQLGHAGHRAEDAEEARGGAFDSGIRPQLLQVRPKNVTQCLVFDNLSRAIDAIFNIDKIKSKMQNPNQR